MANQVMGLGTSWNLPNYAGELFAADATQTPLLSMTGGLTGGRQTDNLEFPTAVLYDYPEAEQPEISEQESATAPQARQAVTAQETNVVQIHQEVIDLSYVALSNRHRMSGLNTAGQEPVYEDERLFQMRHKLIKVARDVEHSFINGTYLKSASASEANRTRGLLELTQDHVSFNVGGEALTGDMLRQLYRAMADAGAYFNDMVMFLPAYQKQQLTEIYAQQMGMNLPLTRQIGGVNITQVETDFFHMGIVWNRFVPADTVLIVDVAHVAPVFQVVPGKGVLFTEELAKTGAAERLQLFGQIGLAHGAGFLHGSIRGLRHG
ncbi:MAG: DUF5309 domain-containing protein [Oscillospiraceae bacterium]|nr:DUF5309 domain-containing protein [Oscillospiraceae bacterium]